MKRTRGDLTPSSSQNGFVPPPQHDINSKIPRIGSSGQITPMSGVSSGHMTPASVARSSILGGAASSHMSMPSRAGKRINLQAATTATTVSSTNSSILGGNEDGIYQHDMISSQY